MSKFNINDLLKFAISIEEKGENFYKKLSEDSSYKEDVRDIFKILSEEEKNHFLYFKSILDSIDSEKGDFNEEYYLYIKSFIDNAVFKEKEKPFFRNLIDVVDFAMSKEIESINFYNELKELLDDKEKINVIISEEKKHFRKLFDLKLSYK